MALANVNLEALREKILAAQREDEPILTEYRDYARRIKSQIKPLRPFSANAVSFVSADGGDNRLTFNPSTVELIRVVDSRGNECALDALPSSARASDLDKRGESGNSDTVAPLQRMCAKLGKSVSGLSYLVSSLGHDGKTTGSLRAYRDLVEWAVLFDLVTNESLQWGGDTIIVRDGLLRTKTFRRDVFPLLDSALRNATARHLAQNVRLSIVGVAKQSAVISRLAVALELEAVFHKSYPCYVRVPREIEEACYKFDRTWLDTLESVEPTADGEVLYQSLGNLFLVKFGDGPLDPVWPVDIAEWQVNEVEKILGQLSVDAQFGFPIPDYPMCIQKAHDFAKMTGLEMVVLQDVLMASICDGLSGEEAERMYRMQHLSQTLADRRYKEG